MRDILAAQFTVLVIVFTGWTMNLIKLIDCDFEAPYKAEAIHTIGLIPPIGMITGWMDIEDGGKEEQTEEQT